MMNCDVIIQVNEKIKKRTDLVIHFQENHRCKFDDCQIEGKKNYRRQICFKRDTDLISIDLRFFPSKSTPGNLLKID